MKAEQVDQGQARGVQSRLRARAEAARTTHDKAAWTRVAILHQLVGCRRLDPDWAKGLAFLSWLHESGRMGGPHDGSPDREETPSVESTAPSCQPWRRPAHCRRCGRFVKGPEPGFCPGCSAVHCPYCLTPDGCEHLLVVVADGEVRPPVVDPSSISTLALPDGTVREPDADELRIVFGRLYPLLGAYGDSLASPPDVGQLMRLLPETVDYPICAVARDLGAEAGGLDRDACYFAWRPDVARDRIGRVVAELSRGFERLAAVIGEGQPARVSTLDSHGHGQPRRRRRAEPPDVLLIRCGGEQHRVSLPSRGPIVLLDHPDHQLVEAVLAGRDGIEGCLLALSYVRHRAGYNSYGWYKWSVHVAPRFGAAGSTIRERLMEFHRRQRLRRLLRDVDLG